MIIPFVPFPLKKALKISRIFQGIANGIAKSIPSMKLDLYQAGMDIAPRDYASLAVFTGFFYFVMMFPLIFAVGLIVGRVDFVPPLAVSGIFSVFVYFYILRFPKLKAARRTRKLERDLLGALQHILIEIKSGVPLFNALLGVSDGYGEVSDEFKKVVKEINAGTAEIESLERSSKRNPSLHFRRALWQITNAIRAGSDIANALEAIVNALTAEQVIAIRRYGQELSPYAMMYMLIAVIMPTLGITFLIILSSFAGLNIPTYIFPVIILALGIFQFFYMGIIKTKRPAMV